MTGERPVQTYAKNKSRNYLLVVVICIATALLAAPLRDFIDLANIVMLFLLEVFMVSLRLGKGPAVLAAFLSVALFDFFFVPPHLTFAVADAQYLLTFLVMLIVALITGQLTAGLRRQSDASLREASRTRSLYRMAEELSGALSLAQVAGILREFLRKIIQADFVLLVPGSAGALQPVGETSLYYEPAIASMVYEGDKAEWRHAPAKVTGDGRYYALPGSTRMRGVLVIAPLASGQAEIEENHPLLEMVASLVAITVERLHFVAVAQEAQIQMESERLRNSVLSAVSHDLRTPLTSLVSLAESLSVAKPPLSERQRVATMAIRDQALRLCGLVEKLLNMARLHAGEVKLCKEWQPLEEVIGASIKLLDRSLAEHPLRVDLPPDLPALEFDAVLLERVFCNLLENAAKYAPAGSPIEIAAHQEGDRVAIAVSDHGPGIPEARQKAIFDMFVRGAPESPLPGVGLGLAICRAIVLAHGGEIGVRNRDEGGACFVFSLPVGEPPVIEEDPALPESIT